MRTRFMPFTFLPLDGISHTEGEALTVCRARHPPGEHHEALLRCRLVPPDHAVEPGDRDLDLSTRDAGVHEPFGAEVLDLTGRKLDSLHATISAAVPTMREKRGTTSSRSTCAQNSMSASSPGGP